MTDFIYYNSKNNDVSRQKVDGYDAYINIKTHQYLLDQRQKGVDDNEAWLNKDIVKLIKKNVLFISLYTKEHNTCITERVYGLVIIITLIADRWFDLGLWLLLPIGAAVICAIINYVREKKEFGKVVKSINEVDEALLIRDKNLFTNF